MKPSLNQSLLLCLSTVILSLLDWKGLLVSIFIILGAHFLSFWLEKNRNQLAGLQFYFLILILSFGFFIFYKLALNLYQLPVLMFVSYVYLQCTGYLIEILKGAERLSVLSLLNTNLFFLKALAGPIERPHEFENEVKKFRFSLSLCSNSLSLFILGALKKSLGDSHYLMFDLINTYDKSTLTVWVSSVIFLSRIYCDFSGYTDMARGIAQMVGVQLSENFNHPFRSQSLSEFWNRWHISLTSWFRDYLYSPLLILFKQKFNFNSQNSRWFMFLASFVTFLAVGFWHSVTVNFIFWALLNAAFLSFFPSWFKRPVTLILMVILNVMALRLNSFDSITEYLKFIFGFGFNKIELSPIKGLLLILFMLLYLDLAEKFLFKSKNKILKIAFSVSNIFLLGLVINPMMAVVYGKF